MAGDTSDAFSRAAPYSPHPRLVCMAQSLAGITFGFEQWLDRFVTAWQPLWKTHQKKVVARAKKGARIYAQGEQAPVNMQNHAARQRESTQKEMSKARGLQSMLSTSILDLLLGVVDGDCDLKVQSTTVCLIQHFAFVYL